MSADIQIESYTLGGKMHKYLLILIFIISSILTAQEVNHSLINRDIPDGYLDYEEITEYIINLETQNQDLMSIIDYGYSQENNQILKAVKVSNNVEGANNLLFLSGIRANDLSNMYLNLKLLTNLLSLREEEPYVSWLENVNFYFIITLNPDGLDAVIGNSLNEFQNNLRDINQNNTFDSFYDGVDLYYNFDSNWIHGITYNQYEQGSLNYRGSEAYSEAETKALVDFIDDYSIHSALIFNNTTDDKNVVFPYNWLGVREIVDYENLLTVADEISDSFDSNWQAFPQTERNGNILDWLFVNKSISAFMLSNSEFSQIPSVEFVESQLDSYIDAFESFVINTTQDQFPANIGRMDITVTNASSLGPESVNYKIMEVWSDSYQNHQIKNDGKVSRFLFEGLYNIKFSKKGFKTISLSNVQISNNTVNNVEVNLIPLDTALFTGSINMDGNPISGKLIIDSVEPDTIYFNPTFSVDYFQGIHQITVIPDDESIMPYIQEITLSDMGLCLHLDLVQTMLLFEEIFEGSCCNWTFDGPWLVVSDSSQNNSFLADSWEWLDYYDSGANISFSTVFPIDLSSFGDRQAYLEFDTFSYTEWDNDFISVELIISSEVPQVIWSRSGKYDSWEKVIIPLDDYMDSEFYVNFRLKDGIEGNPNHELLTDPGWRVDNIRLKVGAYTTSIEDEIISQVSQNELQIYPNPFNPVTNIRFKLIGMETQETRLNIYNVKGQLVKSEKFLPTKEEFFVYRLESNDLASGIYMINIKNKENNLTKKAMLLK